jgi:hypothetical protein
LMREREVLRRARIRQDADAALHDAGLRLDQQRREVFEQRSLQERRKIERQLLQEIEAKRRTQLPALNDRLRREFQDTGPAGAASVRPTNSASPKR